MTMKKAFTLAEVLVTLAIIGVIAALTIPAVITKATKAQYVTGVRKAFNTLKQVEREAMREYGDPQYWTYSILPGADNDFSASDFDKYFKPHFDIVKFCGESTDDNCFADKYKSIDGKRNIKSPNDNPGYGTGAGYVKFVTADGISWMYMGDIEHNYRNGPIVRHIFEVDVNGRKGPNVLGRDYFSFWMLIMPQVGGNSRMGPHGSYMYDFDYNTTIYAQTSEQINEDCNTTDAYGYYCAAKVLSEGAMNY